MKEACSSTEGPCATTPGMTTKHWWCAGTDGQSCSSEVEVGQFSHYPGSLATIGLWLVPTHTLVVSKRAPSLLSVISGLVCPS